MTPRPRTPAADTAPARRVADEVKAAVAALRRAVTAGKVVRDDIRFELIVDDLASIDRDLTEAGR